MSPLVASVLGGVVGVLATLLGLVVWRTRQQAAIPDPGPLLSPALKTTIEHLRGAAAVLGPHDEILVQSSSAASSGVVRGSRLAQPEMLELVREARHETEPGVLNVDVPTGLGLPSRRLAVRVSPLGDGLVLLVADDRSEALRIDETRRDFVANVTHELKTPIGAISLLAEAIADAADDPDAVRHFAGRMSTETARLNELISQIIALSRLQSSDPLLAASPIDVDDVVDGVVDQFREQAHSHRITLTQQHCTGATIRGDRSQLEAALRNLIQNAIAYSEADQARVFERFFRVDYGRSRAHGGTGLGLSIVKHIAAAHGGAVSLWSRLGQGSTFTLRLPALHPENDVEGSAA